MGGLFGVMVFEIVSGFQVEASPFVQVLAQNRQQLSGKTAANSTQALVKPLPRGLIGFLGVFLESFRRGGLQPQQKLDIVRQRSACAFPLSASSILHDWLFDFH